MRTFVYIDGFNFYYLAVKNTPYKWVDFNLLLKNLLNENNKIERIKYYTAMVEATENDPDKRKRQQIYLTALKKYIPYFEYYKGHFLTTEIYMPLKKPEGERRFVEVIKTEEKGSDVNLAVHLVNDAWKNLYDCAVIISNDSDLVEAIKIVRYELKKTVGLLLPERSIQSKELSKYANFIKRIRSGVIKISQLPDIIPNSNIEKPKEW
ncbi:MAG: NYN domain-containing protein [Ignavibacteriales bacterium]|nr:NYN domain-containing protein [Ignavibacteriales bacterium]